MATVLGLLGFALFIPAVITLAAAVTWAVVRISPAAKDAHAKAKAAAKS